jgi:D-sedoheptulose 7-phosphate isomerase
MRNRIIGLLKQAETTLHNFMAEEVNLRTLEQVSAVLVTTFQKGNKVIVFGNGGSMCDAMHFAEELTGKFRQDRPPLPAIAISDPSHITCVGNDYGFEEIFARGVQAHAKAGDVAIGISTSGNSVNVIKALRQAKTMQCITIALLGGTGGELKDMCDYQMIVPATTSDRVQEVHIKIIHILIELIEGKLFG